MIRMIAVDLDGTLLAGKSNLPEENVRALRRAMDAGVQVAIVSGRMIESTLPIAEAIGVNAPMSLFNGAMLYDLRSDAILSGTMLSMETARRILRELERIGVHTQAFPGRGFYMEKADAWSAYYTDKVGVTGIETGVKLSEWLETDVFKLLCLGESAELSAVQAKLIPMFPEATFVKSADTHLEIVARGVDKATGLRELSAKLGIAPEEIIAFGDEMNDLPMIEFAGTGYAMENGAAELRARARCIAPKNTDCGVARIVNLFMNEGRMGGCAE